MIARIALGIVLVSFSLYASSQSGPQVWREKGWCGYGNAPDSSPPARLNLPDWACAASYNSGIQQDYSLSVRMNPFFITGDFDGDGVTDIAIWIQHRKSKKRGVVFFTKNGTKSFVAGPGGNEKDRGDDYSFIDAWSLVPKGETLDSPYEDGKILLKGDAVVLVKSEASAFVIHWDNGEYRFYQVSD